MKHMCLAVLPLSDDATYSFCHTITNIEFTLLLSKSMYEITFYGWEDVIK
jgi:hypothetical protein